MQPANYLYPDAIPYQGILMIDSAETDNVFSAFFRDPVAQHAFRRIHDVHARREATYVPMGLIAPIRR
jgi:hypothetical protein